MPRQGELVTNLPGIMSTVAPLGEGDPVRWAQSLPGVASGADGGSAFYVRGGNAGANLITIDGVPIYGFSHVLGLATVVPSYLISETSLIRSGFHGSDGNLTGAHLNLLTKSDVTEKLKIRFNANNFLAGAGVEGRINNKFYYVINGRISPLSYEYQLIKDKLSASIMNQLDGFKAEVGDVFAKAGFRIDANRELVASLLLSKDMYSISQQSSNDRMGWRNSVAMLKYTHATGDMRINTSLSYSKYFTGQGKTVFGLSGEQDMNLASSLQEVILSVDMLPQEEVLDDLRLSWGSKLRYAGFNPGQLNQHNRVLPAFVESFYVHSDYSRNERLNIMATIKANYYRNSVYSYGCFNPELSLSSVYKLNQFLSVEADYDHLVQYYHTLEGLPTGWSLDMIVPALRQAAPECSDQLAINMNFREIHHTFSIGPYYRQMRNLVYYKYSQGLFNGGMANWENSIDTGKGRSFGVECLYCFSSSNFDSRVSYTWSKTNRYGFMNLNSGEAFHARFDREHILNVSGQWNGLRVAFTYQSGQWESALGEDYIVHTADGDKTAEYFAGVNDYHMPDVMRFDVGYGHIFHCGRTNHELNIGVYNLFNNFNPFLLFYDYKSEGWKMLAMMPIMPNFSWKVEF